jgi:hypothetical protein
VNIPDEAVEAVANIYAESDDTGSLETARAAVEAAAPYLIKEAYGQGWDDCRKSIMSKSWWAV